MMSVVAIARKLLAVLVVLTPVQLENPVAQKQIPSLRRIPCNTHAHGNQQISDAVDRNLSDIIPYDRPTISHIHDDMAAKASMHRPYKSGASSGDSHIGAGSVSFAQATQLAPKHLDGEPMPTSNRREDDGTSKNLRLANTVNVPVLSERKREKFDNIVATNVTGSVNKVLNVQAPPYRASGDGRSDDTSAIQSAIYAGCGMTNPPTTSTSSAIASVYLPSPSKCYLHSAPLRIPCKNLEFYGPGSGNAGLCQNYVGESIIQKGWRSGQMPYAASLVPGPGNSLVSQTGSLFTINLARYMNGTGSGMTLATEFANGFDIGMFVMPTGSTNRKVILGSFPAYPGPGGDGAFKIVYDGSSRKIEAFVMTTDGEISLRTASCEAQSLTKVYFIALDWDRSTYRLWQGVPGGPMVLCASTSSNRSLSQSVFEDMVLPANGPYQFWPDGSSLIGEGAFTGDIDSIRFQKISTYGKGSYETPTVKFAADSDTYGLLNFLPSLDGTQRWETFNDSTKIYSIVVGGGNFGDTASDNLHDLELCSNANGAVGNVALPDGLYAGFGNGSTWKNLHCSHASYSQFDFGGEDYLAIIDNIGGFGGHVGIVKNGNFADTVITNSSIDGTDVACEVNIGAGGGAYTETHPQCVDRGGLRYGWIEDQGQALISYPFVDQEAKNIGWVSTYLFNDPFAPYIVIGGNIDTRNGAPYIIQDGGGYGSTFLNTTFTQYGTATPAEEIIKYTHGEPTTPTQLINTLRPNIPITNISGGVIHDSACRGVLRLAQGSGVWSDPCIFPGDICRNSIDTTAPSNTFAVGSVSVGRSFSDGKTNNSMTLTSATAGFVKGDVGRRVHGSGIIEPTYITRILSGAAVALSRATSSNASDIYIYIDSSVAITKGAGSDTIAMMCQ